MKPTSITATSSTNSNWCANRKKNRLPATASGSSCFHTMHGSSLATYDANSRRRRRGEHQPARGVPVAHPALWQEDTQLHGSLTVPHQRPVVAAERPARPLDYAAGAGPGASHKASEAFTSHDSVWEAGPEGSSDRLLPRSGHGGGGGVRMTAAPA